MAAPCARRRELQRERVLLLAELVRAHPASDWRTQRAAAALRMLLATDLLTAAGVVSDPVRLPTLEAAMQELLDTPRRRPDAVYNSVYPLPEEAPLRDITAARAAAPPDAPG